MQPNRSVYVLADVSWQSNNEQCLLSPWMITVPGTVRRPLMASMSSLCASGFLDFFQSLCFQLSSITTCWLSSSVALSCPLLLILHPGQRVNLFSFASCWTSAPLISVAVRCLGREFCKQFKFIQDQNWTEHSEGEKICSVLLITKKRHQEFAKLCEWSITACTLASLSGTHHSQLWETGY